MNLFFFPFFENEDATSVLVLCWCCAGAVLVFCWWFYFRVFKARTQPLCWCCAGGWGAGVGVGVVGVGVGGVGVVSGLGS